MLETLFAIGGWETFKFTYPSWVPVSHAIFTLAKLSLFIHEDWDLKYVRETIDLSEALGTLISSFQRLCTTSFLKQRVVMMFSSFKETFERKRSDLLGEPRSEEYRRGGSIENRMSTEPGSYGSMDMGMDELGQLDDGFWNEMMGDWPNLIDARL